MTQKIEHTQGPWILEICGNIVGADGNRLVANTNGYSTNYDVEKRVEESKANAEFIVRACNSHYELLEALEIMLSVQYPIGDNTADDYQKLNKWKRDKARAAIAKATGAK